MEDFFMYHTIANSFSITCGILISISLFRYIIRKKYNIQKIRNISVVCALVIIFPMYSFQTTIWSFIKRVDEYVSFGSAIVLGVVFLPVFIFVMIFLYSNMHLYAKEQEEKEREIE